MSPSTGTVAQEAPLDPDSSMTVVDRKRQGEDSRIGEGATVGLLLLGRDNK
jgi:hypothetical protein